MKEIESQKEEVEEKLESLNNNWDQLKQLVEQRHTRLDQARSYQQFRYVGFLPGYNWIGF